MLIVSLMLTAAASRSVTVSYDESTWGKRVLLAWCGQPHGSPVFQLRRTGDWAEHPKL